jgi:hypothetical protein
LKAAISAASSLLFFAAGTLHGSNRFTPSLKSHHRKLKPERSLTPKTQPAENFPRRHFHTGL